MKINTSKGTYFVTWKHEGSELDKLCLQVGIRPKEACKLSYSNLKKKLGVSEIPKRERTTCVVSDATGEIVATYTVTRMHCDEYSKEYARRQSLKMALELSCEGKDFRKTIWENYLSTK
jgi:hypothetical protein